MADPTTRSGMDLELDPRTQRDRMWLVLVWCRDEPHRVGEALRPGPSFRPFGREPGHDGLDLLRVRPDGAQPRGSLHSPSLSRVQLRIRDDAGKRVVVENVGRPEMRVNGTPGDRAEMLPGDVIELHHLASFLAVRRPADPLRDAPPAEWPWGRADADGIVGESPACYALRAQLIRAARRRGHVLVLGESGTGKELVARALHRRSGRAGKPFVSRSAITLPEGLVDAELFGHARNYPNPGTPAREGLVGAADGGVLFLDELGEVPETLQAHLLRLLDQGEYQRLGETHTRRADLRVVGVTNRHVGELKHDLVARFRQRIPVPGLDRRAEDIPLLVAHLMRNMAGEDPEVGRFLDESGAPRLDPELVRALCQHRWHAHVRELEQVLWQAADASTSPYLQAPPGWKPRLATGDADATDPLGPEAVREALERCNWVQEQAWRELGLTSRHVLHRLMKRHGIERP